MHGSCTSASAIRVFGQERHPGESLAAGRTRVLLDVGVSLEVSPEIRPVREGAVAVLTRERLLAGVRPDMTLQEPRAGEGLPAELALAGKRVRPDVHLQSTQGEVDLLAVLAAERLLGGGVLVGSAVELLVLGEPGVGGVGLVAEDALVAGVGALFASLLPAAGASATAALAAAGHAPGGGEIFGGGRRREVRLEEAVRGPGRGDGGQALGVGVRDVEPRVQLPLDGDRRDGSERREPVTRRLGGRPLAGVRGDGLLVARLARRQGRVVVRVDFLVARVRVEGRVRRRVRGWRRRLAVLER